MAHSYRKLQHWNQWLSQNSLGESLLQAEREALTQMLKNHFGKHVLLIGVPQQASLLNTSSLPCHTLISPLIQVHRHLKVIEADLHELPIHTGSVDLVILPHTLDFVDNPRQLLSEACRVIKPEGLIVISGFNPLSSWGLYKFLTKKKIIPWSGAFLPVTRIKRWLNLADFKLEKQKTVLFRPPVVNKKVYQQLNFLETLGSICLPAMGGAYLLVSRAKVIPLTPIKMQWKQQLGGLKISTTIPGHLVRSSK